MKKKKSVRKPKMSEACCDYSKRDCSKGCFYGLGFIGAAIYYISMAPGFWMGVLGVLKALVWPVFLVFELLKYIGA